MLKLTVADFDRPLDLARPGMATQAVARHIRKTNCQIPGIDRWNVVYHWLGGTIHLTDTNWALLCEEQGWPEERKALGAMGGQVRLGHKGTVSVNTLYNPRHADKATHIESSFYGRKSARDRNNPLKGARARVAVTCITTGKYRLAV